VTLETRNLVSLLEQMRIGDLDLADRKKLLSLGEADIWLLRSFRPIIETKIDSVVARFYELQTSVDEIALLIGDSDTLGRLRSAQHRYVLELFSGNYDLAYVNNRLRIGLVHKRIGVPPRLYLAAVNTLESLLIDVIRECLPDQQEQADTQAALRKLFFFDITLVFETYIRGLVSEIEISREKTESYAKALVERSRELENLANLDPLTGLQNVRHLHDTITRQIRVAQRRHEPLTIAYLDVNDFKLINDTHGHLSGDEVLRGIGAAIKKVSRLEDSCFRYGGDEFCMVLSNCSEPQAREIYGARLNAEIQQKLGDVSVSAGFVQTGPQEFGDAQSLVRIADERMFAAKRSAKALSGFGDSGGLSLEPRIEH
jgi:diguanylate cyclase